MQHSHPSTNGAPITIGLSMRSNLDGVDPDATKAAMDQDVVANKEEAESLLQMSTRSPKTLTEVKEARRKMAAELKSAHPEVYTDDSKTHLPAAVMPEGEFTSAAAAKKIGATNPCGAGAKTLDPFLKDLAEGHEIRRQMLEVNSSETHYAFDELLAAICPCRWAVRPLADYVWTHVYL